MAAVHALNGLNGVDFSRRLIRADADNSRKSKRITAGVAIAFLNSIEGDFKNDDRFNATKTPEILQCVLLEEFRHFRYLDIG
jgi:hypothetical protein